MSHTPSNQPGQYFQNQFLVSTPQLIEPTFKQSVILICKHDETGAVGIVINRASDHHMSDIFQQLEIVAESSTYIHRIILEGGPVYPELGLIVHDQGSDQWESTMEIGDGLFLTTSRDILDQMAKGNGPDQVIMSLGYAGWAPGQLEHEIKNNSWFTTPVNKDILFSQDMQHKWTLSAKLIGIDPNLYSHQVGHA